MCMHEREKGHPAGCFHNEQGEHGPQQTSVCGWGDRGVLLSHLWFKQTNTQQSFLMATLELVLSTSASSGSHVAMFWRSVMIFAASFICIDALPRNTGVFFQSNFFFKLCFCITINILCKQRNVCAWASKNTAARRGGELPWEEAL